MYPAIGFRPHASVASFGAALAVLLLFVTAVSWLAAAFGLPVSAPEAANAAMFMLMFFTYASSAFVPVATMPWWLRGFDARPGPLGTTLAWCGGILVVSMAISAVLFRRPTG